MALGPQVSIDGVTLPMSSAPGFGGDALRVNPEQLYVASLSACQALTYLFLAAGAHVPITGYSDDAIGELAMVDGVFRMATVTLRPQIGLEAAAHVKQARALVEKAHRHLHRILWPVDLSDPSRRAQSCSRAEHAERRVADGDSCLCDGAGLRSDGTLWSTGHVTRDAEGA
jgi:organic hydroperoxide reductase OsmC/OhrA